MTASKNEDFFGDILDWEYPKRHTSKSDDYISFKAKDPVTGKLRQKKYSLMQYAKGNERDMMAGQMTANLLRRLQGGWNPFVPDIENRSGTLFTEVTAEYRKTLKVEESKGVKKPKTVVDYCSRLKQFESWAIEHKISQMRHCTSAVVDMYLQYKLVEVCVTPRSRNNDRTFLSAFFGWCVSRRYLLKNPCEDVKSVKNGPKQRVPLTDGELIRVRTYLLEHDRHYLLAVYMQYFTLIRPKELAHLRLCDISIERQTVIVPEKWSKNGREEPVALNDKIVRLMIELNVFASANSYFLFGKDFKPSAEGADERIFRERWSALRKILHIPKNRKFYSLKDKGIIDLIKAEGAVNARDQARHSSIAVTNTYSVGGGKNVHEETKHFKGKL